MTRVLLALAILFLPLAAAQADEVPIPPAPTRWATDTAGFMSPLALQAADRMLEDFERATGNQILVWIGRTTGDTPLEDWTIKAFERWKVGRQGLDNGLIFFVFADDRKARIEVGYGLEDKVPDALGSRILNDEIIPRIRAGDHDGAVLAGINGLRAAISGGDSSAAGSPVPLAGDGAADGPPGHGPRERSVSLLEIVIGGLVVVGFLILLVTNPSLALYILFSILSSGGGGRGGGGGFSGGGGRSGGGGASGSW